MGLGLLLLRFENEGFVSCFRGEGTEVFDSFFGGEVTVEVERGEGGEESLSSGLFDEEVVSFEDFTTSWRV